MVIFLLVPLLIYGLFKKLFTRSKPKSIDKRHIVITGGSSGIGKSLAILAAKKGANVSIIARNPERLTAAKKEIQDACIHKDQTVTTASVDVANFPNIKKALEDLEQKVGHIYMLVNCAGIAICGKVEEITQENVKTLIDANFLGTLYPIQAVVPLFKKRGEGIIVLTASQVALMGMYGYSVYSSCKFALRGLAESIAMELKPYNISVTLALPPDTDTPGFEAENKTKPEETKLISQSGGLIQPELVAEKLLEDALCGNFFSYVGFESFILTMLCVGMSPFASLIDLVVQSIILGPLRLIGAYYLVQFDKIVQKCHARKEKSD